MKGFSLKSRSGGISSYLALVQLLADGRQQRLKRFGIRVRRLDGVSAIIADIMSSHCRVATTLLALQADSASISRTEWR